MPTRPVDYRSCFWGSRTFAADAYSNNGRVWSEISVSRESFESRRHSRFSLATFGRVARCRGPIKRGAGNLVNEANMAFVQIVSHCQMTMLRFLPGWTAGIGVSSVLCDLGCRVSLLI